MREDTRHHMYFLPIKCQLKFRGLLLVKLNVLLMSWPEFTEPSLPSLVECGVVEWCGVSLYAVTLFSTPLLYYFASELRTTLYSWNQLEQHLSAIKTVD